MGEQDLKEQVRNVKSGTDSGHRPLRGLKVVEVGVWHAGPGAGAILTDLGADVIKVESIAGEPERYLGNFGPIDTAEVNTDDWTVLFDISNRGKRSVSIDLSESDGRSILTRLITNSDVFLTNLRPSSKRKLGLDYESLRKHNEQIIYAGVSGFGAQGPLARAGAFDTLGQAMSGMMYLSGLPEPAPLSILILDQLTAITASHAILTALYERERTGRGQEVHTSLYGSATWLMHANLVVTSVLGRDVDIAWDRRRNPPLRTTYKCGDGKWIVGTAHPEDRYWAPFCAALGVVELTADRRFATKDQRVAHGPELMEILDEIFLKKDRPGWLFGCPRGRAGNQEWLRRRHD